MLSACCLYKEVEGEKTLLSTDSARRVISSPPSRRRVCLWYEELSLFGSRTWRVIRHRRDLSPAPALLCCVCSTRRNVLNRSIVPDLCQTVIIIRSSFFFLHTKKSEAISSFTAVPYSIFDLDRTKTMMMAFVDSPQLLFTFQWLGAAQYSPMLVYGQMGYQIIISYTRDTEKTPIKSIRLEISRHLDRKDDFDLSIKKTKYKSESLDNEWKSREIN